MTYDEMTKTFHAWWDQQVADRTILSRADKPLAWRAFQAGVRALREDRSTPQNYSSAASQPSEEK
jgi:hypothetical protein